MRDRAVGDAGRTAPQLGARVASGPFRPVPPATRNIWVPAWSRKAALAGLGLRAPCRPSVVAAHHTAWAAIGVGGPQLLPGRAQAWHPPTGAEAWEALCDAWTASVGAFDGIAIYERPQHTRAGVGVLLLHRDRSVAFVKVLSDDAQTSTVWRVLEALDGTTLAGCRVPRPLGRGIVGTWRWLASAPLPAFPHRPARRPPIGRIAAALAESVRPALDAAAVPGHWQPMHGDLAPWNLRRVGARALWLLDWDEVGWGPPGADEVYYEATSSLLRGRPPAPVGAAEAVRFWSQRVGRRLEQRLDAGYDGGLLNQLSMMA